MNVIIKAAQFARNAHAGQVRKYTNRPYITHPMRVAGAASMICGADGEIVAAAWLHDVIEDCGVTAERLLQEGFTLGTVGLVLDLTNPSKGLQGCSRGERKQADRAWICRGSYWAKVLKCLDRLDNLQEIDPKDGFTRLYCQESRLLCEAIAGCSPEPIFGGLLGEIAHEINRLTTI
jgi:(p)ppGpp synthase/HD superfamily hydrolase